jgi:hypothetical protein
VVVVVVVVVDVSGAFWPPPHAAVSPTIATIAVPPTAAAMRRARRFDLMVSPLLSPSSEHSVFGESRAIPHGPWSASVMLLPAVVHRPHPEVGSGDRNLNSLVKWTHSQYLAVPRARHERPAPARIRLTVSVGECLLVVSNKRSKLRVSRMVWEVLL